MIGAVREWLAAVVAVSLLLAAVQSLVPEGNLKRIASFTGGLLLLLVLLQPLEDLTGSLAAPDFGKYSRTVQDRQAELEQAEETLLAEGIASRTAAYIWDKANQLGLACQVTVATAAGESGIPLPDTVTILGPYSPALAAAIEEGVGIPVERQYWLEESEWTRKESQRNGSP